MIDNDLLQKLYPKAPQKYSAGLQELPTPHLPTVTQRDAENKFMYRYFARSANDTNYIVEINEADFIKFSKNPRFYTTKITWKIIGKKETITLLSGTQIYGIADINRQVVANADLTFKGLRNYITDYLQFWLSEK